MAERPAATIEVFKPAPEYERYYASYPCQRHSLCKSPGARVRYEATIARAWPNGRIGTERRLLCPQDAATFAKRHRLTLPELPDA